MAEKYDAKYHILDSGTREEQLKHIDKVLWENRKAENTIEQQEKVYDLILGMAAVLTKIALREKEDKINFDSWRIEINHPYRCMIYPINDVEQAWLHYHFDEDNTLLYVWAYDEIVLFFESDGRSVIEIIIAPQNDLSEKEIIKMHGNMRCR